MTPATPVRDATLGVHGHEVSYAEAAATVDGEQRPVSVLVHGIGARARPWEQVMAVLGRTCLVLAPDLLGHGDSAEPRRDCSLGAHARGVRDLLAALGHERVSVVGHSVPGRLGRELRLVAYAPAAVRP